MVINYALGFVDVMIMSRGPYKPIDPLAHIFVHMGVRLAVMGTDKMTWQLFQEMLKGLKFVMLAYGPQQAEFDLYIRDRVRAMIAAGAIHWVGGEEGPTHTTKLIPQSFWEQDGKRELMKELMRVE